MMGGRFIVDDCGTLIDMETRETYDYVCDVLHLLNKLDRENRLLKSIVGVKEIIFEED